MFAALAAATVTDLESGLVFDAVTIPALLCIILIAGRNGSTGAAMIGAASCAGIILTLFIISRGRGIGLGDLKLAACIGAGSGLRPGLTALGIAFVIGAVHGIVLLATSKIRRGEEIRFAPYLAAGAIASLAFAGTLWP